MTDRPEKIAIVIVISILMLLIYLFRRPIPYLFCSLEKYTGKRNGKSSQFFMLHLFISIGITLIIYSQVSRFATIDRFFETTVFRLLSVLLLWLIMALLIGLLIELYLVRTDTEYKNWKQKIRKNTTDA